jgi:hypothetical protein
MTLKRGNPAPQLGVDGKEVKNGKEFILFAVFVLFVFWRFCN